MTIGLQIVTSVLLVVVLGLGAVCLWQWLLIRRKNSMLGRLYDESIKYKNLYYETVNDRLDAPHSPSSCNDDRLTRLTKEIQEMEEYIQDLELQLLESDEIIDRLAGRRGKGRRGEMCPQGTQKSHSGAAACLVAYLCVHASHIALPACGNAPDVPHIALPACGKAVTSSRRL